MNKEYAPIVGVGDFVNRARQFALGKDSAALAEGRVASVQSLSGTGACRLIGDFYNKFLGSGAPFYLPKPSWGNHGNIFKASGLDVRGYSYLDAAGVGFDMEGMIADLKAAPDGSAVLLHACAHNPTGVDPTNAQWEEICAALKPRAGKLHLFFDSAYQVRAPAASSHRLACLPHTARSHHILTAHSHASLTTRSFTHHTHIPHRASLPVTPRPTPSPSATLRPRVCRLLSPSRLQRILACTASASACSL